MINTPQTLLEMFKRLPLEMQAQSHTWETEVQKADARELIELMTVYAQSLEDACTPRAPKPEWFGTGPGQWDSWWVSYEEGGAAMTFRGIHVRGDILIFPDKHEVWLDAIVSCVPVARTGFPSPVGWQVVGG